ncbi:MAG: chemotaxis protein CheX [Deltaproteobacteria bacterium]|nr:chemotaxis protein CheX [Nannocystaceae bacterium]
MERSNADVVLPQLGAAARELLVAYGLEVGEPEPFAGPCGADETHVAAMMGFMGDACEGVLAIQAPTNLIDACAQIPGSIAGDPAALADWIGELTNQLLGRMYNKLLSYERITRMTRPMFAAPGELGGAGPDRVRTTWLRVPTSAGHVLVVLELHAAAALVRCSEAEQPIPMHEGELALF